MEEDVVVTVAVVVAVASIGDVVPLPCIFLI